MENKEDLNLTQTKLDTLEHINLVRKYLNILIKELMIRAEKHDASKFSDEELPIFAKVNSKLKTSTFGSKEYKEFLKELGPALEHHYRNNSHHPEFYPNGIEDFDLIDLVELFSDWAAAVERHDNGNIHDSIEKSAKRFKIGRQLKSILTNTANRFINKE